MCQHYVERPRTRYISQTTAGLVPSVPARPAVAPHKRSLSHLALGDYAAADARYGSDPLLRKFLAALPRHSLACRRAAGRSAAPLVRARILRSRAQFAKSRSANRRETWWTISSSLGECPRIARHWKLHCGRNSEHRIRRKARGPRRQRRARPRAPRRNSRRPSRVPAVARVTKNRGSLARIEITGRLESSHDGSWRDAVHSKISAVPALSNRAILCRAKAGRRRILARKTKEARHRGSYSGRRGIHRCQRSDSSPSSAEKY